MYFLRYFEGSKRFFSAWFSQKDKGHDQDGFNSMSRYAGIEVTETRFKASHIHYYTGTKAGRQSRLHVSHFEWHGFPHVFQGAGVPQ